MKIRKYSDELFQKSYLSIAQIMMLLADPTFMFGELGRGSGKTTHILGPRIDRVQNDMPGALLVLAASTYKSILDNIIPGVLEYFMENYEKGIYFELGKKPPGHFRKTEVSESTSNWNHTISFANGTIIKFVSCDRPESMLGLNAAHLFVDEMIRIPEDKFVERIIPALRANRALFGHSHYFGGITGFSSTPNFETDEDWWLKYEENMNSSVIKRIQEIAYNIDKSRVERIKADAVLDLKKVAKCDRYIERWSERLKQLRYGQTFYLRASSFSNVKILGIDYIKNQVKSIKDPDKLNTSIFSVRKHKVKDRFFGKFGKKHIFSDSYIYDQLDELSIDGEIDDSCRHLKHWDANKPLILGYDPGPFSSLIVSQKDDAERKFRTIKNMWVYHPQQHAELAQKFDEFFAYQQNREIILHYDRAANQQNPKYRDFYPLNGGLNDSDANLLAKYLRDRGWIVHLMSMGQGVIYYSQLYRLVTTLFGDNKGEWFDVLVDENQCEELISSIFNSPIKRHEGKIMLDKSSERLPFDDQIMYSTQLSSAFLYLLWGEFNYILPESDRSINALPEGSGTYLI